MQRLTFPLPVDLNGGQLLDELQAATLDVTTVSVGVEGVAQVLELICADDINVPAIEAVIAAHVPSPVVPIPTVAAQFAALTTVAGVLAGEIADLWDAVG